MEAEKYFCGVVEQMRGVKVKAVFSCCPSFGDYDGIRRYIEDNEIYILFENDICLVISYRFIDALRVEMRALSDDERAWYEEAVSGTVLLRLRRLSRSYQHLSALHSL